MFNTFIIPKKDSSGGSNIKSLQRGQANVYRATTDPWTKDVTISSVDLTKSIVQCGMVNFETEPYLSANLITIEFVNPTTIRIKCEVNQLEATSVYVYWEVIEFNNVRSKQNGEFTVGGTNEPSVSISTINPVKSLVFIKTRMGGGVVDLNEMVTAVSNVAANSLTFMFWSDNAGRIISWQLIEFN